jgi:hypothetical protein
MESSEVDSSPLLGNGDIEEGVSHSLFYPGRQTKEEEAKRIESVRRANMGKTDRAIKLEDREKADDEREERQKRRETSGAEKKVDFQFPRDSLDRKIVNPDGSPYLPEKQIERDNPTHETNLGFSETTRVRPGRGYWYTNEDKRNAQEEMRDEARDEAHRLKYGDECDDGQSCCGGDKCRILGGKKTKRRRYNKKQSKRNRSRKSRRSKKRSKNNKK